MGTKELSFSITPMPVSDLTLKKLPSKLYTGEPITPKIELRNGDSVLSEGTDYSVSYQDNVNMNSRAKVNIMGMGNYSATRVDLFSIVSATTYSTIFEGEGTQNDPYLISTSEDLKKLADKVNAQTFGADTVFVGKYFALTNDIDISNYENWIPIGFENEFGYQAKFYGIFDGQGHTISGLSIASSMLNNQGLFGYSDGDIINLHVTGRISIADSDKSTNVGGICGESVGNIENCVSNVDIIITNSNNLKVGGITGSTRKASNCINYGNITIDSEENSIYAGGISGWFGELSLIGCQNFGDITAPKQYAGGIVGYLGNNVRGNLIGCVNEGNITRIPSMNYDSIFYAKNVNGSIFGCHTGEEMKSPEIIDSVNEIFLRYKKAFPNEKYIYKYIADTKNINDGYPILNLSIVTTVLGELSEGIALDDSDIEGALMPLGYHSVDELKTEMETQITQMDASINSINYFDFILRYTNGPNIGETVAAENFPENGIDIKLPYPEGTNADNFVFTILHIKADGTSEFLEGRCMYDGILFHTNSLSPFAIGWAGEGDNISQSLSDCSISTIIPQQYTGEEIKPAIFVYANGRLIPENKYDIIYSDNIGIGTATVTVNGIDDYTGTISKEFQILSASIKNLKVNLESSAYTYNGVEKRPTITVTNRSHVLTQDNYAVTYENNVNAGRATIIIEGKGNYSGKQTKFFEIERRAISNFDVFFGVEKYLYSGKAVKPNPIIKCDGKAMKIEKDYTISYQDNINVGTAKVLIVGKGNYIGNITKSFKIAKASQIINYTRTYEKIYGTKPFFIKAKLSAGNGKLSWVSSNKLVAVVSTSGKVKIKGTGSTVITITAASTTNYTAKSVSVIIKVKPGKQSISSVKAIKGGKLSLKWKKNTKASGYEIQYSTDKKFKKGVRMIVVKKNGTTSKITSGLTKKKVHYIRIRAYKTEKVNGKNKKLYGQWSVVKSRKTY
jgi:hypothetical protein